MRCFASVKRWFKIGLNQTQQSVVIYDVTRTEIINGDGLKLWAVIDGTKAAAIGHPPLYQLPCYRS
jgi:hypothetical protein